VNAAYRIRGTEWTELVIGDPQWPKSYYPTPYVYEIREGDILVGICTYHNNEDHEVVGGSGNKDELCHIYIMFYTENKIRVPDLCFGHANMSLQALIPDRAKIRPPFKFAGNWTYPTIKESVFSHKNFGKTEKF
jgi:hypothetical protein